MARISSAAYVTAVLNFLQAYNAGDLDACEQLLDSHSEWHAAGIYHGRLEIRAMLEAFRTRFSKPRARPDDFRAAGDHVLMVVCFTDADPEAPYIEERQSWLCEMTEDGLISAVATYQRPADAARALDAATALKVHA
jgi:ketosteroid isomerase-like protein